MFDNAVAGHTPVGNTPENPIMNLLFLLVTGEDAAFFSCADLSLAGFRPDVSDLTCTALNVSVDPFS
jgi:hypothetical protein